MSGFVLEQRHHGVWPRPSRFAFGLLVVFVGIVVFAACGDEERARRNDVCGIRTEPCATHADCCSGICVFGECGCTPSGAPCAGDSQCCDGEACIEGICTEGCRQNGSRCAGNGECCSGACEGVPGNCDVPRCNAAGSPCVSSADCCNNLGCREGTCQPGCGVAGASCGSTDECCGGFSCGLAYECERTCAEENEVCDPAAERLCCDGKECIEGICKTCFERNQTCGSDTDCCGTMVCESGVCSCAGTGEPCSNDDECCQGSLCIGGTCECSPIGGRCRTGDDCCDDEPSTLACNEDKQCRPDPCHPLTWECLDASDCCEGGCENGACCGAEGTECEPLDPRCCAGLACFADTGTCAPCGAPGHACIRGEECCSGACLEGTCRSLVGGSCATDLDCGVDAKCEEGTCCGIADQSCNPGACCSGFACGDDNRCFALPGTPCMSDTDCYGIDNDSDCVDGACCLRPGIACSSPSDCCSGACEGGVCACGGIGTGCSFYPDCCSDRCDIGGTYTCVCAGRGGSCKTASDCCTGFDCSASGTCCGLSGQTCVTGADCCSGNCPGSGSCN